MRKKGKDKTNSIIKIKLLIELIDNQQVVEICSFVVGENKTIAIEN